MGLKPLDLIVLIGYFVVIAAIGFLATRLVRNREDYLMGGRRFGKAMMIMFAFGAGTHADSAVGVTAQSYKYGLPGIWYQWVMLFTLPIYWLLAPVFRRARVLTTADFFERRFGTEMMYVYSFFALFVMLAFNGTMFYGAAKVIEGLTGGKIPHAYAILLMAAISFAYGVAGGLIAAVWNDFFQGVLTIVMSLLIIPFFWDKIGGLHGFQSAIAQSGHPHAEGIFSLVMGNDMTIFWIVMMSISSLTSMVAQPQILVSAASAKSEMDSRIGFVGGMILKRLMTVPWALTGLMAIAMYQYTKTFDADHTYGKMAADLLPAGFVGLMMACVMASVMDNCAVNMLSFSGIYTNSIHQRLIDPGASEAKLLQVNRVTSVIFALVSIGISFLFDDVPTAMRFLWQTVPLMGIAWFMAILWKRANRWGAIASFVGALAASATANYVLNWRGDAGLPYTILLYLGCGIGAGILFSLITPAEDHKRTEQFFMLLKTPIGQEQVLRDAGFRESPGNDTFDLPAPRGQEPRGFSVVGVEEPMVATAVAIETETKLERPELQLAVQKARRQSIIGFVSLIFVVLGMLGGMVLLARWLSP
jgi:Na+/proline symporter